MWEQRNVVWLPQLEPTVTQYCITLVTDRNNYSKLNKHQVYFQWIIYFCLNQNDSSGYKSCWSHDKLNKAWVMAMVSIKGQLISKWFFGVIDFLQKMNEQIRRYYYDTSGRLVFVCFLEEIDDPKKPFRN